MNDREQPKGPPAPPASAFEVPDLDLGALPPRSVSSPSAASPNSARPASAKQPLHAPSDVAPNMFDDDAFSSGSAAIELSDAVSSSSTPVAYMGGEIDLGFGDDFGYGPPSTSGIQSVRRAPGREPWPSGKPLLAEQVSVDPVEVQQLAAYGPAPGTPLLAPLYTYRVLVRRRALGQRLRQAEAEYAAADAERELALAGLAEQLRPELERSESFRRLLEPLVPVDQLAGERGRALASSNAEHAAKLAGYDSELGKLSAALSGELTLEAGQQQLVDALEANNKRAEAKLKRVQIEARAVQQLLQQKLGPQGGPIPPEEQRQLAELEQRATALQPEVEQTRTELAQGQAALSEVRARIETLRRTERQLTRQKQALGKEFGKELAQRHRGLSEAESRRRKALAEVGVAVLAAGGSVAVPAQLIDALRAADRHAEQLQRAALTARAALSAYDLRRYKQGFIVVLVALGLLALWLAFKVLASSAESP
jgi:hypothetical protein